MGIFSRIATPTRRALRDLFSDSDLSVNVTYKKFTGQGLFDSSLGYVPSTYEDHVVKAIRLRHNKKSAEMSEAPVEIGDEVFMFQAHLMPSGMSLKDLIIDEEGNEIKVKGIDNIFNIAISVSVEGGRSVEGSGS